ncbi:MAG: type IV secretion protein Rhs, partial [Pseudomonadota bacterium]|nr:type IV secretion protein Rhs [Pseudomonadota bacterium]
GVDAPPEEMDGGGENNLKTLKSRNGVTVRFDDTSGSELLHLETPGGQTVTLKDGPGAIELVDSNGNSVKLETAGVTVDSGGKVSVSASMVEVSASMVTVNAGISKFSGTVQADTVITNSIIAASYTPGAGNIW